MGLKAVMLPNSESARQLVPSNWKRCLEFDFNTFFFVFALFFALVKWQLISKVYRTLSDSASIFRYWIAIPEKRCKRSSESV